MAAGLVAGAAPGAAGAGAGGDDLARGGAAVLAEAEDYEGVMEDIGEAAGAVVDREGDVADAMEGGAELPAVVNWIQCAFKKCKKWRRLADGDNPANWDRRRFQCDFNEWDEKYNECSYPLEQYEPIMNEDPDANDFGPG